MNTPFQTLEEVAEYLSGGTIECLVCGRQLQRLNRHLQSAHNLQPDEYRSRFGIPYGRSLTSRPSREKSSRAMTPARIQEFMSNDRTHLYNMPNRGYSNKPRIPAVANQWKKSAELGRWFSRAKTTIPCVKCGVPIEATMLGATQPFRCEKCTTPGALKSRRFYWRRKLAA